jgi:hypothetical protein
MMFWLVFPQKSFDTFRNNHSSKVTKTSGDFKIFVCKWRNYGVNVIDKGRMMQVRSCFSKTTTGVIGHASTVCR